MISGRNKAGFTLVELCVVVGLVGVLALIISQLSVDVASTSNVSDLGLVRDQLAISVRSMASNLGALRASMANAQNSYYKGCICGGGSCVSMKTQSPFYLYDSSGKNLQSPAYYTTQGASCGDPTGLASSCFFQVTTSVVAECLPTPLPTSNPSPPWQCGTNGAEFIQIAYTVGPNPLHSPVPVVPVTIQSGVYANVSDIVSAAPSPSPAVCP